MSARARTLVPAVVLFAAAGLTGCAADPQSSPPGDDMPTVDHEVPEQGEPAHWSYGDGDDGPAHWGELDDAYSLCADGSHQSPVDLPAAPPAAGDQVVIDVDDADGVVADTGHTFQFTVGDGGGTSLTFDGEEYDLVQMHYHVPSEHTVEGDPADVEFHFVHQSADGGLLVLGLMAEEGTENPGAQPFIDAVDADEETDTDLDLSAILPDDSAAYSYEGSLTTPACSEGVHWLVLEERIELSPEQLSVLTTAEDHNARPTQPLGDREIDGADLDFVEQ